MKYVDIIQNTPEWSAWRGNRLGGSDAPSVMNLGYLTPYQLYLDKMGLYQRETSALMQRGHDLEPLARAQFIQDTGIEIMPRCVESTERPWMAASLDGIDKAESLIVEIKTGGEKALERAKSGIVPDNHFCQIQHQLEVTGLDHCIYYFYDGRNGYPIDVYRNTKYISSLVDAEKEFWDGVLNFVPPPLSERDYTEQTGEWLELAAELLPILETQKRCEKREREIRDRLIAIAGDKNAIGGGIKMTRIPRQGAINYQNIPELKGVDLNKYRKEPVVTWRISKE